MNIIYYRMDKISKQGLENELWSKKKHSFEKFNTISNFNAMTLNNKEWSDLKYLFR